MKDTEVKEKISGEFLAFAKGDERNHILNTILHEMNTYDKNLYKRYTDAIIDCGQQMILTGDSIKDMYNTIPYSQRSYLIV